jgi:hypothetical protein
MFAIIIELYTPLVVRYRKQKRNIIDSKIHVNITCKAFKTGLLDDQIAIVIMY